MSNEEEELDFGEEELDDYERRPVGGSLYAPDGRRLPVGWITKVSTSSGTLYYRNDSLNKSSWDPPVAGGDVDDFRATIEPTAYQSSTGSTVSLPRGSNPGQSVVDLLFSASPSPIVFVASLRVLPLTE